MTTPIAASTINGGGDGNSSDDDYDGSGSGGGSGDGTYRHDMTANMLPTCRPDKLMSVVCTLFQHKKCNIPS
jgi:hypothetical protein